MDTFRLRNSFLLDSNLFNSIELPTSLSSELSYLCEQLEEIQHRIDRKDHKLFQEKILYLLSEWSYQTLLVAFAFWTRYPKQGDIIAQFHCMENEIKTIGNLVSILNSDEENKRKAARMKIAFQRMSLKLKEDLYDCFFSIATTKYIDFIKEYKKIYVKLNRI